MWKLYGKDYISVHAAFNSLRLGKKVLGLTAIFVLVIQLLLIIASGTTYSAYALGAEPPKQADFDFDFSATTGFEAVVRGGDPEFVLRRGTTGIFNITLTNVYYNDEMGASIHTLRLHSPAGEDIAPDGITYSITPSEIILDSKSTKTATVRITAAPSTELGTYRLDINRHFRSSYEGSGASSYSWTLIIDEGPPLTTTVTATTISSVTLTSLTTTTATLTETITNTSTKQVAEPLIYTWAIGATVAAAILAVVALRRSKTGSP